jgi:hypothetical protein
MPIRPRQFAFLLVAALLSCGLGGCGTINGYLAAGTSDYLPQWMGGLPADAPPRPGSPKYDAYMQERERQRLEPAPAKTPAPAAAAAADAAATPTSSSALDPVH